MIRSVFHGETKDVRMIRTNTYTIKSQLIGHNNQTKNNDLVLPT